MFLSTPVKIVSSNVFIDLPLDANGETIIDQLVDAIHVGGPGRWESIAIQTREVGKSGSLRYRVLASVDAVNWFTIAGVLEDETSGEHVYVDINPGGLERDHLTNGHAGGWAMAFRYFKIQVMSPSTDPTKYAVAQAVIFAR